MTKQELEEHLIIESNQLGLKGCKVTDWIPNPNTKSVRPGRFLLTLPEGDAAEHVVKAVPHEPTISPNYLVKPDNPKDVYYWTYYPPPCTSCGEYLKGVNGVWVHPSTLKTGNDP